MWQLWSPSEKLKTEGREIGTMIQLYARELKCESFLSGSCLVACAGVRRTLEERCRANSTRGLAGPRKRERQWKPAVLGGCRSLLWWGMKWTRCSMLGVISGGESYNTAQISAHGCWKKSLKTRYINNSGPIEDCGGEGVKHTQVPGLAEGGTLSWSQEEEPPGRMRIERNNIS